VKRPFRVGFAQIPPRTVQPNSILSPIYSLTFFYSVSSWQGSSVYESSVVREDLTKEQNATVKQKLANETGPEQSDRGRTWEESWEPVVV